KYDTAGSKLYASYLGGSASDFIHALAVDSLGDLYLTGEVKSTNMVNDGVIQVSQAGSSDCYLAKLIAHGSVRIFSTYLGGTSFDRCYGIALDSSNNVYLTGQAGANFRLVAPIQAAFAGYYDAFITKINAAGNAIVYSTYLGGPTYEHGAAIAVDS